MGHLDDDEPDPHECNRCLRHFRGPWSLRRGGGVVTSQVTSGHYTLFSDNNRQIIHLVPSHDDPSPNGHYSNHPSNNDFITSQQK